MQVRLSQQQILAHTQVLRWYRGYQSFKRRDTLFRNAKTAETHTNKDSVFYFY